MEKLKAGLEIPFLILHSSGDVVKVIVLQAAQLWVVGFFSLVVS